eukprot:CAMPEP_0168465074 /NCGR_PEP_ID=MMETSP0228-20121227/55920_1 /TAXON_ID=133427 /ORGANISM="Protoceratium reticulatum, Strain CCCM 535 (=CCMP 1889)" /LENGTH=65 /DNA_ID=CAMNT_0008480623 /DNA_START=1 /DNA_END=195 /DNA_ORIENTATION=+
MDRWVDDQVALGGTSFTQAFTKAFRIITNAVNGGQTTGCNRAVLFLTDGQDTSGMAASEVQRLNT